MVAGDPRLASEVAGSAVVRDRDPTVLVGDHSGSAAATVAALAERALRRVLDADQRSAVVSLAVGLEHGHVAAGPSEVLIVQPRSDDLLVVEQGLLAAARPRRVLRGTEGSWPAVPQVVEPPARAARLDEWTARSLARLVDDVVADRGRVVAVPDGFLALHGRIALVPDHRAVLPDPGEVVS